MELRSLHCVKLPAGRMSYEQPIFPTVLDQMAFSMRLLSIFNTPSSTNRANASQRFNV